MQRKRKSPYPTWFFLPAAIVYGTLFLLPTLASFWFAFTRWDLYTAEWIGLDNFRQFFSEPFLVADGQGKGVLSTHSTLGGRTTFNASVPCGTRSATRKSLCTPRISG